jgi:hypothetical protein
MLSNSYLRRSFWAKAASTACHLINCSPSTAIVKKTPIEVWSSLPYDYSQLRVFGCIAYAHVDNGKLDPRAIKCIFLGYGPGVKAYKLWNPEAHKAFYSRNVVFNESTMFTSKLSTNATNQNSESISVQMEHIDDDVVAPPSAGNSSPLKHSSPIDHPQSLVEGRTRRQIIRCIRLIEECNFAFAFSVAEEVDSSHEPLNSLKLFCLLIVKSGWVLCIKRWSNLRRMVLGMLFVCLRRKRQLSASGFSIEKKVRLQMSMRGIKQG